MTIRGSVLKIACLFAVGSFVLWSVFQLSPQFTEDERPHLKVPKNFDDARALGKVLHSYKDTHYYQVLLCYFTRKFCRGVDKGALALRRFMELHGA